MSAPAQAASPTLFSEAQQARYMDYLYQRMDQVDKAAIQAQISQFTQQIAQQDKRMAQLDLPMLDIQKQALANTIAKDAADTALKWAAQDLQNSMGRGQLALSAAGQMATEAINRDTLAQHGYQAADQQELAREQAATAQVGQAEAQGLARQTAGVNASDAAQDNILASETLGAGTLAAKMNDQALEAARIAAGLRGPRDAFQQQRVMWGMNQSGLAKAVDALKGMPGVTAYQAPQERPERATLSTLADQMGQAGGGPSGVTPWDLMMQTAQRNVGNPIGIGTENMLTVADRNIAQQYSPYAQAAGMQGFMNMENPNTAATNALMNQAQRNEATQYSTPSSQMNQQVGAPNINAAGPVNDQDIIQSGNDAFGTAWNTLVWNGQQTGVPPSERQAIDLLKETYQLTEQQASQLHQQNRNMFLAGLNSPTVERIGQMAGIIKQTAALGNVSSPLGAAQRAETDYNSMVRNNGGQQLAADDPKVIDLIMQDYGVDRETARQLSVQNHDRSAATGRAPTIGEIAPNIAHAGGGYQSGVMAQPQDPVLAAQNAVSDYKSALTEFNVPYLSFDDPKMVMRLQDSTRLPAAGAVAFAKANADYYVKNGVPAPDDVIKQNLEAARKQYGADAGQKAMWGAGTDQWAYPSSGGVYGGPPGTQAKPFAGNTSPLFGRVGPAATGASAGGGYSMFSTPPAGGTTQGGAGGGQVMEMETQRYNAGADDPNDPLKQRRAMSRFSTPAMAA